MKRGVVTKARENSDTIDLKKICIAIVVSYIVLIVLFYFLAGHQLHFRESRGDLSLPQAKGGTVELVAGSSVEQRFSSKVQLLEHISIQWGSYYRKNAGKVNIELLRADDRTLLMSRTINAAEVAEGAITTISTGAPIGGLYNVPLLLKITSDSVVGSAVSPLKGKEDLSKYYTNADERKKLEDTFQLYLNSKPADGMLCFSVTGEDNIWIGLHYWEFVAIFGLLLVAYLGVFIFKVRNCKKSFLYNFILALTKYRFLINQLVSRDFKTKYKRSVLGVLWSFLNPLLMLAVQYFVFSTIFKANIKNYQVYLLTGIVIFNFFSEACGMTLNSILGNASLITKVYVPKYIYPLTRILSSGINLLISLLPLLCVVIISGATITKAYLLLPFVLACLMMFSLGLGMLLASSMVFFRDTQFLWNVFIMIWMYATPIFYPETILPNNLRFILDINPLYYFIRFARICLINGVSPEPSYYIQCAAFAVGMLAIGAAVFKKTQDKFVLYL